MTTKEKAKLKEQLKAELLAELQQKREYPTPYSVAHSDCEMYFSGIKLASQHFGARMICENAARQAFKERHGVRGCIRQHLHPDGSRRRRIFLFVQSIFKRLPKIYKQLRNERKGKGKWKACKYLITKATRFAQWKKAGSRGLC